LANVSLLAPGSKDKFSRKKITESTDFSKLAKLLTNKNDRIISYSFSNIQYILADRLPASGNYFYFPWQEEYNKNPKFGIKISSCEDINRNNPKIMYIDKYDQWSWMRPAPWGGDSYGKCIQNILDERYIKIPDRTIYVRRDILTAETGIDLDIKIKPTSAVGPTSPIALNLTQAHKNEELGMKRIGLMFGTNATRNQGKAELRLVGPNKSSFRKEVVLQDLVDNSYSFFEIDSGRYTSGELVSTTGGGVAVWESHIGAGAPFACAIYEYADGRRRFTPGCPIF